MVGSRGKGPLAVREHPSGGGVPFKKIEAPPQQTACMVCERRKEKGVMVMMGERRGEKGRDVSEMGDAEGGWPGK